MKLTKPACLAIIVFASLQALSIWLFTFPAPVPFQISNAEFRQMISDFSEKGGSFQWDNVMSNELPFQNVIPKARQTIKPGGVYLGVGPEQNFTYIAAFEPRIAFIIDIRRQNMLEHLIYKAIFEMAEDRADFISILFSRTRPARLSTEAPIGTMLKAFKAVRPDRKLFERNLNAVTAVLLKTHQFPLSAADVETISRVYEKFFAGGPTLDYGVEAGRGTGTPTYEALMNATDREGRAWSYLASESAYRRVRQMEQRNLVIPIVGDFAGTTALRRLGTYLNDRRMLVSVFYISNVEQYLFLEPDWPRFYRNVAALPLNASSTFIRTVTRTPFNGPSSMGFASLSGSMTYTLDAFLGGRITDYHDVVELSSR